MSPPFSGNPWLLPHRLFGVKLAVNLAVMWKERTKRECLRECISLRVYSQVFMNTLNTAFKLDSECPNGLVNNTT